jgi:hypothetical protein
VFTNNFSTIHCPSCEWGTGKTDEEKETHEPVVPMFLILIHSRDKLLRSVLRLSLYSMYVILSFVCLGVQHVNITCCYFNVSFES